jgi:ADP-dependent NAD(P)H-hydrate dehydratase / NAD(P)H-hydrate epimerase
VAATLAAGTPAVVDADGLQHLPVELSHDVLLTPHAGELARLLDVDRSEVETQPLRHARAAAECRGCIVLLKGPHTLVVAPDGRVRVNTTGPAWLATAGAGDVLAGLCGSLLASGLGAFDAGSVGAWLHGAAASWASGGGPITAREVAEAVPAVIADLLL